MPVVGIEPSCVAVFRDELVGLLPHDDDAKRLCLQTLTLAEFLRTAGARLEPPRVGAQGARARALPSEGGDGRRARSRSCFERIGLDFEVLDSGCCGLAGSFGFEHDHYDISVKIGERRLLPAVRDAAEDTLLVADGFSCKTQIEQLTDRRALHTAQVIRMAMEHGAEGPPGRHPEAAYPDLSRAEGHRRGRAAAVGAGGVLSLAALALARQTRSS